ncbi:MAG: FliH/SctL family protein [Armatimonadia bacterium]
MTASFQPTFAPSAQSPAFTPLFPTSPEAFSASLWEPKPPAPPPAEPEEVLAVTEVEAERLLAEAQARADELVAAQVRQAVEAARQEQVEAFTQASETLLASLERNTNARLDGVEKQMALLLSHLLERLVHQQIAADDQAIVSLVRAALQRLTESGRVQVVIAPQHEPALRQAYDDLAAVLREDTRLEIVVADTAEAAGCVVHGDRESIDARLSTRLEAIGQTIQQTVLGDAAA